jgi:hypothetical protein
VIDVLLAVFEIFEYVLGVGVEDVGLGGFALCERHCPASVLDTGGDVA